MSSSTPTASPGAPGARPPAPGAPGPSPGARRSWLRAAGVLLVLAALLFALFRFTPLTGLGLFGEETRDRSGPVLLESLRDMSRYDAASGSFQVVVDLEKDVRFLPDAVRGTRTLYVGAGTVDAYVDLGRLGAGDVTVNEDRTAAALRLPHAALGKPALDPDRSYAVAKQRGLLDRLGDLFSDNPNTEQAVQRLAVRHIADAAGESRLTARAEQNTTRMLQGLLRSLGFQKVTVSYGP
ncbi:DUF4230 domain-containing protein [Streptomyces sp. LP05-1]|uniref:DUF4230 domain-containing protein n=1 Tax=Streptomyces pyxinae TaxID=2970734 RepID=A0ABT2CDJ4_9ACTN|nr:DUF4230 domain-containing protein [Streptomyces sp. LP05-1]MCS0635400.1 DUF4230 domain-containing protein [Streptomyces sp. LP05-1]